MFEHEQVFRCHVAAFRPIVRDLVELPWPLVVKEREGARPSDDWESAVLGFHERSSSFQVVGDCACGVLPMSVVPKASIIGDERGLIKTAIHPEKMVIHPPYACSQRTIVLQGCEQAELLHRMNKPTLPAEPARGNKKEYARRRTR